MAGCGRQTGDGGFVPGVGQFAGDGQAYTRDNMTISVGLESFYSFDDPMAVIISDRLGFNIFPADVSHHDDEWLEQLAAADALPDILGVDISSRLFNEWVLGGVVRSIPSDFTIYYPNVSDIMTNSDELAALSRIYGRGYLFIPSGKGEAADSGRIYYRKDWVRTPPDTAGEFLSVLEDISGSVTGGRVNTVGITLSGGVTYIMSLFGTDPESWVYENDEWIPAYYSYKMIAGLSYARALYQSGALDGEYTFMRTNTVIGKFSTGIAGSMIRHGDAFWMHRIYSSFAAENGISMHEAQENHIAILPPPSVIEIDPSYELDVGEVITNEDMLEILVGITGTNNFYQRQRYWPRSVDTVGYVIPSHVQNDKLFYILSLVNFILSEEAQNLAYFGINGVTSGTSGDGARQLYINPKTQQPFDIVTEYPASRLLHLMEPSQSRLAEWDTDVPSPMPPSVKDALNNAAIIYGNAAIDEGDGFLIRFIRTPAKDEIEETIDYIAMFNSIVTSDLTVEDHFNHLRLECERLNIRAAIDEVNEIMNTIR